MKTMIKISVILLLMIILLGCKKENVNPICEILEPLTNTEINFGEDLQINIEASDEDGDILKIEIYINDVKVHELTSKPYAFIYKTSDLFAGDYTLKILVFDNKDGIITDVVHFTILNYNIFKDPRDDQEYKTVTIGNQIWFAENLNYSTEAGLCYDQEQTNCETYGKIYTWEDALNVCPNGWHLPDNNEWKELLGFVDSNLEADDPIWDNIGEIPGSDAALQLKATSGWGEPPYEANGPDSFGFNGIPAGMSTDSFDCYYKGGITFWWSSTQTDMEREGDMYYIYIESDLMQHSSGILDYYYSVRCIKD